MVDRSKDPKDDEVASRSTTTAAPSSTAGKARDRFRTLVLATSSMVWTAAPDGTAGEDSPSWRAFTGQTWEEAQGRGWLQAVHPDDRDGVLRAWKVAVEERSVFVAEYRIRRHDGVYRHTAGRAAPVVDHAGFVLEWVGTNTDITDSKRAEERLRLLGEASTTLASSLEVVPTLRSVSRLLVPSFADWLTVDLVDDDGAIRRVVVAHADPSKAELARKLEAFTSSDIEGSVLRPVQIGGKGVLVPELTPEQVAASVRSEEHHAIARELGARSMIGVALRAREQLLGVMGFAITSSGRRYDEEDFRFAEEIGRVVAVVIDNARLYEAARRERVRAEEASAAKDEFLAAVSHELRAPLNAILGWAQLLRRGTLPVTGQERAFEIIERNTRSQAKLIEDLLDVSRIVAGKLYLELGDVDLVDVVAIAAETVKPSADAKGVGLHLDLGSTAGEPMPIVRGDASRLQQVVSNILSNGVKFTPAGGRVDVVLRVTPFGHELVVRDTGVGMSADFIPQVFERFRQSAAGSSRKQGLGLGMTISRHIVDLHGGSLTAESDGPGRGSTFTMSIPVARQRRVPAARASTHDVGTMPEIRGARILVVDDEPDTIEPLVAMLEQVGATVRTANTASLALEELAQARPDALISDLAMHGEDGYSLIRKVRALAPEAGGHTPAIALSAHARLEDRTRALVAGFNLHVAKPVETTELVVALASLLGRLEPSLDKPRA